MIDREKVIKEFEKICGYTLRPHEFQVLNDVLALLKEQEAVIPIERNQFYYCGACHYALMSRNQNYCSNCGQAVKWDG